MNCLPIIEREMRIWSRRAATYYLRALVAGGGMLGILSATGERREQDQSIFMILACGFLGIAVTQLSGCFLTADCVSSEKRDGTLGLLFLTPLRARDIVIGKLASHSLLVSFSMLALAPVFFIPLLNGGITATEALRVFLGLLVSLFLSLSIGMLVSCLGREAKSTAIGTFVVLVLLNGLPLLYMFVAGAVFGMRVGPYGPPQLAPWTLPLFGIEELTRRYGDALYWGALAAQTALGAGALIGALYALRRLAGRGEFEAPAAASRMGREAIPKRWTWAWRWFGLRKSYGWGPLRSGQPYYWIAARQTTEPQWLFWFRRFLWIGFGGLMFLSVVCPRRDADDFLVAAFWFAAALHALVKGQLILEATRQLNEDRRAGCLELILSTPLDRRLIIDGVHRAVARALASRTLGLLLLNVFLVVMVLLFASRYRIRGDEMALFIALFMCGATAVGSDYRAARWHGAYCALKRTTHLKAALSAGLSIVAVPWALFGFALILAAMANVDEKFVVGMILAWTAGFVIWNEWLVRRARRALDGGLMELVAEPS